MAKNQFNSNVNETFSCGKYDRKIQMEIEEAGTARFSDTGFSPKNIYGAKMSHYYKKDPIYKMDETFESS